MKKIWCLAVVLTFMGGVAHAAPNVTNPTQKGSLLVFPDIRVDGAWNTIIRIENDGSQDVDILCYWMDGNKHRVDFILPVTINQPVWFDAKNGQGSPGGNLFPTGGANGFDNPFLITPPATTEETDTGGPHLRGLLACWAVDNTATNQVKWNHLSGTATVYDGRAAYEYNAYAFYVPSGTDLGPVGTPGVLKLNGLEYDACPQYQIAQFATGVTAQSRRVAMVSCKLFLNQDWIPVYTKYVFDAWNADDVKLTGSFRCADSWHESPSGTDPTLSTGIRYRVQGVQSTQCYVDGVQVATEEVGVIAVQSMELVGKGYVGSTLTSAGKRNGEIRWDPSFMIPEGGIE